MIIIFRRAREWTSLHKQFEWEIMISSLCQSVWHGELRSAMSRASFRQWKSLKFHPFSQSEYLFSCLLLIFARISSEAERGWRFFYFRDDEEEVQTFFGSLFFLIIRARSTRIICSDETSPHGNFHFSFSSRLVNINFLRWRNWRKIWIKRQKSAIVRRRVGFCAMCAKCL